MLLGDPAPLYSLTGMGPKNEGPVEPSESAVGAWLFVLFTVGVCVGLLNLLIAIMGDTFDRIKSNEALEGRMEQARVLLAIDAVWGGVLSAPWLGKKALCYPRCLHVLCPSEAARRVGAPAWEGRIKAITREFHAGVAEIVERAHEDARLGTQRALGALGGRLAGVEAQLQHVADELAARKREEEERTS